MSKKVVIKLEEEDYKWLKDFMTEYRDQDHRMTAYPIAVRVQTKVKDVTADGYEDGFIYFDSSNCCEYEPDEIPELLEDHIVDMRLNDEFMFIKKFFKDWYDEFIKIYKETHTEEEGAMLDLEADEAFKKMISEEHHCFKIKLKEEIQEFCEDEWDLEHYLKDEMEIDKIYIKERWEDRGEFFTVKAAQAHIEANRHHYNEPRDFIVHSWRDPEKERLFEILGKVSGIEDWRNE